MREVQNQLGFPDRELDYYHLALATCRRGIFTQELGSIRSLDVLLEANRKVEGFLPRFEADQFLRSSPVNKVFEAEGTQVVQPADVHTEQQQEDQEGESVSSKRLSIGHALSDAAIISELRKMFKEKETVAPRETILFSNSTP